MNFSSLPKLIILVLVTVATSNSSIGSPLRVFVDPGHGGKDPGAVHGKVRESKITLQVAKRISSLAKEMPNLEIILSRTTDRASLSLDERIKSALKNKADLIVSIHANSSPHPQVRGAEFFVDPPPGMAIEKELTEYRPREGKYRIPYRWSYKEFPESNYPEDKNIRKVRKYEQIKNSYHLAESLSKKWSRFKLPGGKRKGLIFLNPLYLLRHSPLPSVLVEIGYLTHPIDLLKMTSKEEQNKIAKKIIEGILDYSEQNKTAK